MHYSGRPAKSFLLLVATKRLKHCASSSCKNLIVTFQHLSTEKAYSMLQSFRSTFRASTVRTGEHKISGQYAFPICVILLCS
mmetsp:Transcript_27727/g.39672  ORF Transcript_27727/g.39672 Transcript_27727/m.39672 type:complete len:82 (+) Transcript_27727:589-834(+)